MPRFSKHARPSSPYKPILYYVYIFLLTCAKYKNGLTHISLYDRNYPSRRQNLAHFCFLIHIYA